MSCLRSDQNSPQKCNDWLKYRRVANPIKSICMRKYYSNTLSSSTIAKYKSINPQPTSLRHTPFRMHLLRFHCENSFDATTTCLKYLLLHVGALVLIQSSPCYIVWLLPEQHVHCTVLFNSAGIFESVSRYYKATTLHRTVAGKQSTRNRNSFARIFLSASSPPSKAIVREAGSRLTCLAWFPRRNQYGWGIWILHWPNRWRWAWFVFTSDECCELFNTILLDVQYLSIGVTQKRLKLERLTLQKVGYTGLSIERLEMSKGWN